MIRVRIVADDVDQYVPLDGAQAVPTDDGARHAGRHPAFLRADQRDRGITR
ncbi:hypothetical protein JNW91_15810 [Micromonospora sp. STR1_7]|uniref:Uncharacterized protein n=1 Tax=Micromonospora parastrephiae TaxID=2806101 RepID=A0ABS1XVB0_9ACTN|nr:hypothetical protein [Micromonospora parastrephiae]MBM0233201.1 hypothetical protein [Micromonospora parastrephiae]